MKELLVLVVKKKESNGSIYLCQLVKLGSGKAVDVKHILENTFLFHPTAVKQFACIFISPSVADT